MSNKDQRDSQGRFKGGNTAATGHKNPLARRRQALSDEFLRQVKPGDFKEIIKKLIEMAKDGNIHAIREILDRSIGRSKIPEYELEAETITISLPEKFRDI